MINYANLQTDLTARNYTAQSDPQQVATAMNALTATATVPYYVSYRSIMPLIGQATTERLAKLIAAGYPVTHSILLSVGDPDGNSGGLDITQAATQAFVATLPSMQDGNGNLGITTAQVNSIIALGQQTGSYVQQTYGRPLTAADIIVAFGGSAVTTST